MAKKYARDLRSDEMRKVKGNEFALLVAPDFICLPGNERAVAIRMLSALHDTITREQQHQPQSAAS